MPAPREPYSVRQQQKDQPEAPIVYEYDKASRPLRAQLMYGLRLCMRAAFDVSPASFWVSVEAEIAATRGFLSGKLKDGPYAATSSEDRIAEYVGSARKIDYLLDAIEMGIQYAFNAADSHYYAAERRQARKLVEEGIEEINYRFKLHAVGYQYVGSPGEIIRNDSQYVHARVIEPALLLIQESGWKGPEDEFLSALRHHRRGENKAAMNDALNAFESTMKAILDRHKWPRESGWSARHLIQAMENHGVIPKALDSYFGGIRAVLESGVPTLRNKQSGHGQGADVTDVPDHVAAYTLHLTAANIVFLIEADRALATR